MMDITVDMWDDNTPVVVTADGLDITPSLVDFQTDRPFHLDQLQGAWYPELILAQNAAGTRADAVIVSNAETGGRLGIFYQTAGQDDDPRGEVISEWINNWYLTAGDVPNPPAANPNPADGAIDADVASLEWAETFGAATYKVYLSTDATIDDADLIGETDLELQVVTLDPGTSYYWRVDAVDADGVAVEGPVWSLSTLPLEAHFPSPADGASNAVSLELSWTPGKDAIMHDVYYGTDPAALPEVSKMQMGTTYDPGPLDPDTTYYWRVDEFTPAGTITGPVWSFSTIGVVTPSGIADLIAQYEFEEDADTLSALDTSGNDHHGPLLGDASIGGGVLSLDGNGDAVDAGSDPAFHPAGSFSVSAFVNMNSWGGGWSNTIVGTRGESGLGWQLRRHSGSQNLTFTLRGTSGADDPQGSIVPPLNEWIHVAAVYDVDAGTRAVYIDGALDVQIDDSGTVAASDHNMYVGARANGGNSGPEAFFDGDIDSLLIYSRALTIDEIRVMAGVEALPWSPEPADGAEGLSANTVLSWNPGDGAVEQDVYLGFDEAAVADANAADTTGIYRGRQAETTITPLDLAFGATHYWRVDQVDADGNIVAGPVWSFDVAVAVPMDNWAGAATAAGASYLDTFVRDGVYDIGTFGGEQTYEFIVLADPDETEASMALIGRRDFGDTQVGVKYEQWNNTGTYGATVFGVADHDYGVATNPGVVTHLVFVSSEAAGTTDLYVDGKLAGSVASAISLSGMVGIGYGASGADMTGSFDNFDGDIFGVAIYDGALSAEEIALNADVFTLQLADITAPGDTIQGVPNDGDWPGAETPDLAIDDNTGTKYLHFKGGSMTTGVRIEPAMGATVVTGLALTTANDSPGRDPATFELSGSNDSLDGPYTLIASGDVVDFAQADWPRFTRNATGMFFANDVAYKYYQIVFPTVSGEPLMQIAEIELLGLPSYIARWEFDGDYTGMGPAAQTGLPVGAVEIVDDPVRGQVVSLPGGDNQFVDLGGVGISGNMPKTITCWAKAESTSIPDWTLIFGFTGNENGDGGNGSHFNIGSLGGPGGVGAHCWGWEETIFSDDEALEWHHYAMTYDGTTIQYYGDGVLMDTDAGKSNVQDLSASADRVHVGSRITQASS
ncbi:MAG: LamG-like jellyroll fold domain-containing protein, partial [Planctomycetota bacterium]